MNVSNAEIVKNIRGIAKSQGTSLTKIELSLGFGNGMIGKWAKAPKSPPYDKLLKIAEFLGVSVNDILGECKQEAAPGPKTESGLPKGYAQLNPANRAIVDRLIADLAKSQSNG